eukprot:COSAG01_NODE_6230_length_3778_cov_28.633324_4_plen_129_part_00
MVGLLNRKLHGGTAAVPVQYLYRPVRYYRCSIYRTRINSRAAALRARARRRFPAHMRTAYMRCDHTSQAAYAGCMHGGAAARRFRFGAARARERGAADLTGDARRRKPPPTWQRRSCCAHQIPAGLGS